MLWFAILGEEEIKVYSSGGKEVCVCTCVCVGKYFIFMTEIKKSRNSVICIPLNDNWKKLPLGTIKIMCV